MDVQGKGVSIPDGSTSPSSADDTDFGHTFIGNTAQRTFTIQNVGSLDLNLDGNPKVEITGTHAGDFTITSEPSSPVTSGGGTTTFTVEFAPGGENLRTATVNISNNDFDENPYDFVIAGTGHTLPVEIVYWTDHNAYVVNRANLDGSGLEEIISSLEKPHDLVLDADNGKLYFTDPDAGTIYRSSLDGSGLEVLISSIGSDI